MIDRETVRTNLSLGFLITALVLSIAFANMLFAASQPRAQGAQLMYWHSHFPLDTGNRWIYAVQGPGSVSRTWEVKVQGEQTTAPFRPYFELSGYLPGKEPRLVRSAFWGAVVERGEDGKDFLWYEFAGRVGRSWVMELAPGDSSSCEDGASLRIGARDEVMKVPAGDFKQVIRIDYMTKCTDTGITHEWFAPGVGLIRREETSIAGPVVSELVHAEIGKKTFPASAYSTTLQLSASHYWNAQMSIPSPGPVIFPRVNGAFIVRDSTSEPAELVFSDGCPPGLYLQVRNREDEVVLFIDTQADVVCPDVIRRFDLREGPLIVPFSFTLADKDGELLPDGPYSITAILQMTRRLESPLNPAARAMIEVKSAQ